MSEEDPPTPSCSEPVIKAATSSQIHTLFRRSSSNKLASDDSETDDGFDHSSKSLSLPLQSSFVLHMNTLKAVSGKPTIKTSKRFDEFEDAHTLKQAITGIETDEKTIFNILCNRTCTERQAIKYAYSEEFDRSLFGDIVAETSGSFQTFLMMLLSTFSVIYAQAIYEAFQMFSIKVRSLIEVLCSLTNFEMNAVKEEFEKMYNKSLEAYVESRSSSRLKNLLLGLIEGNRHEMPIEYYRESILQTAKELCDTNEENYNKIFSKKSFDELINIFQEYNKRSNMSIEKTIKKKFSGDYQLALLAIIDLLVNRTTYFAYRLHKSMVGAGTDEKLLNRLIITRSENDLKDIKDIFNLKYGKSLAEWIKGDTSGNYMNALLTLIED